MNVYENDYNNFLLQLDKVKNKEIYGRVTALTFAETPIETIEGRITAGSINVDGASVVRRTCSLTIVADNFNYDDYVWGMNTKFKLEIGVLNTIDSNYPPIIWFPQGIYVLTSFNVNTSMINYTINLSGKDKMCLLNGEIGGSLESSIDFGCIEEENQDGNWIIRKLPIQEIIRNAVHTYGKEPYHNIIINDLDTYGVELLEYRFEQPMYLYRSGKEDAEEVYDNVMMEDDSVPLYIYVKNEVTGKEELKQVPVSYLDGYDSQGNPIDYINNSYLEPLVTTLVDTASSTLPVYTKVNGNEIPWYFTKVEYGQTAGYRETDLTYAGDLIANVGESLTSILDKIKNMLSEFEYFYNLDGQFVFQRKQSLVSTMWSFDNDGESNAVLPDIYSDRVVPYTFSGKELITAMGNNPNIANLRNDFSIWGERTATSGAKIPIHLRYAIDEKPTQYKNITVLKSEISDYNTKYNTRLKSQGDSSDTETNLIYTYVAGNNYSIDSTSRVVTCDWREIIYQMALDYFKYNHLDDFEQKVMKANPQFKTGRTGYESYYTDLQGFWRQLYYPALATDLAEKTDEFDRLTVQVQNLQNKLFGIDVADYYENKVGGMEGDIAEINNLLSKNTTADTKKAIEKIKHWNTESVDASVNPEENYTTPPKYALYDENEHLIEDPDVYLAMLQDMYFREKSQLATLQEELNKVEAKKKSLENDFTYNFYIKESDKEGTDYKGTVVADDSPLLYWSKNIYEAPYLLNFWFDFLTGSGMEQYSVQNIGSRPKAIQDTNVKSIYFRETPSVVFRQPNDGVLYEKIVLTASSYRKNTYYKKHSTQGYYYLSTEESFDKDSTYYEKTYQQMSGYKAIQVPSIESMFTISSQGKSAKDRLEELLYQHSYSIETATITTIPIYYLQPNTRIKVFDEKSGLNGDYVIDKLTIPLAYNGTMQLQVTKAVDSII